MSELDVQVKKRSPIRGTFTKMYKSLIALFEDENPKVDDILIKFNSIERIFKNMHEIDEAILEILLMEETEQLKYADEYEIVEEYRQKFEEIKSRLQFLNEKMLSNKNTSAVVNAEKTKLKLPKIELMKFGGDIKDWLTFWSQFKRINDDQHMELEDKFQYLIQCMIPGTRSKEIIDSYPPTAENYHKAIESLQSRFGREELLIEYYVRELLGLVIKNATNTKSKLSIINLYDKLESHLRSLESIGMTSDKYAAMLFPLVESCIPEDILRIWLRNPSLNIEDKSYSKRLNNLLSFLRAEVEGEERISLAKTGIKQNEYILKKQKPMETELNQPTANDLFVSNKDEHKILCVFCGKSSHLSKDCFHGQKMTLEEKMDILKSKKCCYACLKIGHRVQVCRCKIHCICCGKKHYIIMCPDFKPTKTKHQDKTREAENSSLSNLCQTKEVLLQTLLVAIENEGERQVVRGLIDPGSQSSYVKESTAKKLGLKPTHSQTLTHVVFGGATSYKQHNCYKVQVRNLNTAYSCEIPVLDQPTICGLIPHIKDQLDLSELRENGIIITDCSQDTRPIEILIGADMAGKIYTGKIVQLKSGLTAMETYLGWVIMGKQTNDDSRKSIDAVTSSLLSQSFNIEKLWNLEALGIQDPYEPQNKIELENAVRENLIRTMTVEDGRYEVKLPWKCKDYLHDNRILSEKRLEKTTEKLIAQNKYEAYNAVLEEWLQEDIIEVVPPEEISKPSCYLPHRGVFKEGNVTTKVRPVFDASSKEKGHCSLNESLEKGPNTLELIPSILMKFRENRIGVVSDIKKAFLQISVCPEDRNFLRFLWWRDYSKKTIEVLRHKRVVFGVTSSPFILGAVIQNHLDNVAPEVNDIAQKLKKSFYVDNCVTSVKSKQECQEFVETSTKLMAEARMELRGWETNNLEEPEKECEPTSVLGLLWDKGEDTLFCNVNNISEQKGSLTRRTLLSVAQKIFDPIGFTSPVTLYPKLLLQESWKEKLGWDSKLSEEVCVKFLNWFQELHLLKHLKIPRRILIEDATSVSLHLFCDASGLSYAAVVFMRSINKQGDIYVQMIIAKSRIAPLKKMSIPRLELMACTIGVRLLDFVKKALDLKDAREYCWTDSATALFWIQHEDPWGVFVQNRVKEIRSLSNIEDWRHIQGSQNPADLPSRGCSVEKLINSRWWEGPEWLSNVEREWPKSNVQSNEEAIQEKRKVALVVNDPPDKEWFLRYFSSYKRIVRMVAWARRFISNCKRCRQGRIKGELSVEEINTAEKTLMKIVQKEHFTTDYLRSLKTVTCLEDHEGIIRVKTKLTERKDFENFKTPILLPGKSKLVELLIQERHLNLLHCGLNNLLRDLRESFWVINARKTARRIISKCIRCKRHCAKSIETLPVPLPEDRIKDANVFEVVGVDLAGPLSLKGGTKSWIVIYTCAVFRAVHLELVQSLSTKSFLLSFRRFIARRGRPHIVYSDNGTNFVGANNLLKSIDWEAVQSEVHIKRIIWKFNPPTAAWWGGFWERLIQILKKLLRRVLGTACISYEEMITLLYDCEAIINSRPITYISENDQDLNPLTPSMFLQDMPTVGVPDLDHLDEVDITRRFRYQQKLREELRKRFRSEYLGQLILGKSNKTCKELKLNDIVLVEDDSKKRAFWPLGRVAAIFPGKDGIARVVKIKTVSGELLRPVQRVYPLEVEVSNNSVEDVQETVNQLRDRNRVRSFSVPERTTRCGRAVQLPSRLQDFELS